MENLGDRIKRLRKDKGWSLDKLSLICGVPKTTIWGIERGSYPSIDKLDRISKGLEISIEDLVKDTIPFKNDKKKSTKTYINLKDLTATTDYAHEDYKKEISTTDAYEALNTLLCYMKNDVGLKGKELEEILTKVCDLLELEIYKVKKSRGIEL